MITPRDDVRPIGLVTLRDLVQAVDARNPSWSEQCAQRCSPTCARIEWAVQAAWILMDAMPFFQITRAELERIEDRAEQLLLDGDAGQEVRQ